MPVKRHRSIAKHSYISGKDRGIGRAKAHVRYIQFRPGKEGQREERTFFNGLRDNIHGKEVHLAISAQNPKGTVMHKLIVSPGVEGADVQEYTREVMAELCSRKGQDLEWYAVSHDNTNNEHAHVVIMGRDENGRTVRLDSKDYELIKAAGDEYLERNRLLDRSAEKDKDQLDKDEAQKEKGSVARFVDALKAAAHEFKRNLSADEKPKDKPETEYQKRKRERQEAQDKELQALGEDLDLDAKLQLQQKSEERQKADKEKAWREYCKPVEINYRMPDGTIYSATYDRASSLEGLKDLRKAYDEQDAVARDSMTVVEIKRVNDWIKEKESALAALEEKSEKLVEIVIAVDAENSISFNKDSTYEELLKLSDLNKRRQVYLDPVEEKALEKWLAVREYNEPILVEPERSYQTVAYTREDPKAVLSTLLEEYEQGEAILTSNEVQKLRSWIEESKHDELDKQIAVFVEDEQEDYIYNSESSYSQLLDLDASFREGEGEIDNNDYKILRVLIAEKEAERQLELDRQQERERAELARQKARQEIEKPIEVFDEQANKNIAYTRNSKLEDLKKLEHDYLELDLNEEAEKELERLKVWIADREREKFERPIEYKVSVNEQVRRTKASEERLKEEQEYFEEPIFIISGDDAPPLKITKDDDLPRLRELQEQDRSKTNFRQLDPREAQKLDVWIQEKEDQRDREPITYLDTQVSKTDKLEKLKEMDRTLDEPGSMTMNPEDRQLLRKWIQDKEEKEIERDNRVLTKETDLAELHEAKESAQKNLDKLDKWIAEQDKQKDGPITVTFLDSEYPVQQPDKAEVKRDSDLPSLKRLADGIENSEVEISAQDKEILKTWIREKEQERDNQPLRYLDRADDPGLPSSGEPRQVSKNDKLERLKELDHQLSEAGGPSMDVQDRQVLKEWIAEKEAKEEKEKPIEVLELDEDSNPVTYSKEDQLTHLQALASAVEAREIDLDQRDQDKLKDWILEKELERDREEDSIVVVDRETGELQTISKDQGLAALKQIDHDLEEEDRDASDSDRETLKRWVEEKDENEIEHDNEVLTKNTEREKLESVRQQEQKQLEKLEKIIAQRELEKSLELAKEYEKLDEDRTADFEKIALLEGDDKDAEKEEHKEFASKQDKLEKLKELEKQCREASDDERPALSKEDHEKLQAWIQYKEENEIEYGEHIYTKDTPLDELRQFRDELKESRYDQWIEKDKFAKLCSWIREQETREQHQKELDRQEKDFLEKEQVAHRRGKDPLSRTRADDKDQSQSPGNKEARQIAEREDPDGIKYGQKTYSRDTPLKELQDFKENLDESRYEDWIEKEDYKKLVGWIKAKEERGEDAFKARDNKESREQRDASSVRTKDDLSKTSKYRPSALEKRMQRQLKKDKAERIKNYYAEKEAQKERLEKEQHEAMWKRISADKPVVQFINLLRKGAREVQKEIEKFKEKELAKELAKQEQSVKEKESAAELELPFREPKSHLEELANRRAAKMSQREKQSEKQKDPVEKNKELDKEVAALKVVLPYPEPKTHLETLANKKAIELARLVREADRKKEREEREKLKESRKDLNRVEKFMQSGLDKLKKGNEDKDKEEGSGNESQPEKDRDKDRTKEDDLERD